MKAKKNSFDNFDEFAHDYRDIHSENIKISGADSLYFSEFKVKWIHSYFKKQPIRRILDLGAGDGTCLAYFNQYFPEASLSGIDVSVLSIEEAAAKRIPNTEVKVYNGETIPYADHEFDCILIATVLHHISFDLHPGILKEAYRVLKPGGKLFIIEHNPYNPVTRHIVNTCPFDKDAVLLKPSYTKGALKKAGFGSVKNYFILFLPRGGVFRILHFMEKYLSLLPAGAQYVSVGRK